MAQQVSVVKNPSANTATLVYPWKWLFSSKPDKLKVPIYPVLNGEVIESLRSLRAVGSTSREPLIL
jgi:hypothetical protein